MTASHEPYWQEALQFKWWRVSNWLLRRDTYRGPLLQSSNRPLAKDVPFNLLDNEVQQHFFYNVDSRNVQLIWYSDPMEPWRGHYEIVFRYRNDALRYKLAC